MTDPTFFDSKENILAYCSSTEPQHCVDSAKRAEHILNTTSEKANIPEISSKASLLTSNKKSDLRSLLTNHEIIFDYYIGDWDTEPVSLELKPGVTLYHGKSYPVTVNSKSKFKQELQCLISLGILEKDSNIPLAAPSFTIPKKNHNKVRFLMDFRQVNQRIVRKPFPLPKINQILYEIDGMQWASAIDLKMSYYAIRLDPDAQKYCTLITP